jgi:hypothetical protein
VLRGRYEAPTLASRIVRRDALWSITHHDGESVASFINRVIDAADALVRIGVPSPAEERRDLILARAHPRFSSLRSTLTLAEAEPSLDKVVAALKADEATRISTGEFGLTDGVITSAETAFFSTSAKGRGGRRGGGRGAQTDQPARADKVAWCALHGPVGHWSSACPDMRAIHAKNVLLEAIASAKKNKGGGGGGSSKALYADEDASTISPCSREYIALDYTEVCCRASSAFAREDLNLDSGASRTYSPVRAAFADYSAFAKPRPIELADGNFVYAHGAGTLCVDTRVDGCPRGFTLPNSWYVPRMVVTLISTKHLHSVGLGVFMPANGLTSIKDNEQTVAHAASVPAGWLVTGRLRPAAETAEVAHAAVDRMTAHLRLGHLHHAAVTRTAKLVDGLDVKPAAAGDDLYCGGCAVGKQKRAPFRPSENRDAEPGRTICFDLSGAPGDHQAIGGFHYSLIAVDEHSGADWVYLLKRKNCHETWARGRIARFRAEREAARSR